VCSRCASERRIGHPALRERSASTNAHPPSGGRQHGRKETRSASSTPRSGDGGPPPRRTFGQFDARLVHAARGPRADVAASKLGEVIYGGVGSGLYGMLVFRLSSLWFVAGLMIGRTPEYLGKKIGGVRDQDVGDRGSDAFGDGVGRHGPRRHDGAGRVGVAIPARTPFSELLYGSPRRHTSPGCASRIQPSQFRARSCDGVFAAAFWLVVCRPRRSRREFRKRVRAGMATPTLPAPS